MKMKTITVAGILLLTTPNTNAAIIQCTYDSDCPDEQICINNLCTGKEIDPIDDTCKKNSDCTRYDGGICTFGKCDYPSVGGEIENGESCTSDADCTFGNWNPSRLGYEVRIYTQCINNKCGLSYNQYRCTTGYYGNPIDDTSGCNRCPEYTGVYTNSTFSDMTKAYGTSPADTTTITGCYIAAGTYYDATGTFEITNNTGTYHE